MREYRSCCGGERGRPHVEGCPEAERHRHQGATTEPPRYEIGKSYPMPERKLDIRPNAPLDNRSSFKPARRPSRF